SALQARVPVPIRSLWAFRRLRLRPGESRTIQLVVPPEAFTVIDDNLQRVPLYGKYAISAGGGQPESARLSSSDTITITAGIPAKAS
ncbi:MAG TPA: fibronectin type III-like domain-contianing protein, partial [Puia sp.]|nr:fibronectin type III-like domain-contianing protein [Puia sp.]